MAKAIRNPPGHDVGRSQTFGIDVMQTDVTVRKFGIAEHVAQDVLREDRATGADQANLGHGRIPVKKAG
jgi:hypothetical protein